MKTKFKISNRILSLVLAFVMVLGMVPHLSLEAHAAISETLTVDGLTYTITVQSATDENGNNKMGEIERILLYSTPSRSGSKVSFQAYMIGYMSLATYSFTEKSCTEKLTATTSNQMGNGNKVVLSITRSAASHTGGTCTSPTCSRCQKTYDAPHDYKWKNDGTNHWQECTRDASHKTSHSTCSGGTAYCQAQAVCSTCQNPHGSTNPDNHKWGSWGYAGSEGDCRECTLCGTEEKYRDHVYLTPPTCTKSEQCQLCGWYFTDSDNHNWSATWSYNDTQHWQVCTRDSSHTQNRANHSGGNANCTTAGTCTTCSAQYKNSQVHSYTYTADGSVLTETCNNGCGHQAIASIVAGEAIYTGSEITNSATVSYDSGTWAGDAPVLSFENNVTVGTATAKMTAGDATASTTFTINPANLSDATVTLDPEPGTYTGSYHDKPTYTLTYNGEELDEGTDYIVDGQWTGDFLNAGDSILTLKGEGNFTGYKTLTYTINKATPTFTAPTAKELTYKGEPLTLVEAGSVNPGKLLYSLDGKTYSETVPDATNAGNYTVYYKVEGLDTDNYNEIPSGSVSVTISKAAAPSITFPTVLNEITFGQKLEEAKLSFYENDYGAFNWNAPTAYPGNAGIGSYALDFRPNELALQNYDWKNVGEAQWIAERNALCICPNVTVNKAPSTLTAPTANTLTYNGEDQALIAAGATNDGTMVYSLEKEGEYKAELPKAKTAGTYHVWYKVIGDGNHTDSTPASVEVKIDKADPGIGAVTANVVENTLNSGAIVLTRENTDIDGNLTVDAEQTLAWGDNTIRYTFTPEDTTNYKAVKGEVIVTVVDTIAPTGTVTVSTKSWAEFLNNITFGLFFKETQTVSVSASDNLSGVAKIEYIESKTALDLDAVKAATQWTEIKNGSVSVTREDTKQFVYYIRITDKAGNVAFLSSDGAEYDTTAPVVAGVDNGVTYYTTQKVTVTDRNIDTITLNGEAATGSITLEGNKEAVYTIVATDKAGNETTVTVTMKPIKALAEATENRGNDNVTSADAPALEALVEKLDELIADPDTSDDGEKETLEQHKVVAESLLQTIEENAAEQKAVTDEAAKYDKNAVKSTDKAGLEELAEDIEDLLDTDNLTQDERAALEALSKDVKAMIDTVNDAAADSKTAADTVDSYDPATVTSSGKAAIESALETIEDLLDSKHLTDTERAALEDAKADAEVLLELIEEAAKAADTDNTAKVENVTASNVKPDHKSDLEKAKADLEGALADNGGNYTEEEKKTIQDEIQRIKGALETIGNVEAAEDAISNLPATVEPDDEETVAKIEEAKKSYDKLNDYEKSLVDEKVKEKLDKLTAATVDYKIVKGDSGKWSKDTASGLTFTANGAFSKFVSVEIDGKVIDAKHYSAKSGSTIVTLNASYLETLPVGTHTITVVYTNGEAEGTFTVNAKSVTPATGDDFDILLWISVMTMCLAAIAVLLIEQKKRKFVK